MPIPTAEERIGTILDGKYQLVRVVARGGMAVVFEGRHVWTRRRVAVKLLSLLDEPARSRRERFVLEARAAASLGHPNVVDVLDMGEDEGALYVAMEFLEGITLEVLLREKGRLTPRTALQLLLPITGALARAHDAGIIHRDLKPANVFISRDESGQSLPKLLDFGVAKAWHDVELTHDGLVVGTPHYMSPEQVSGEPIGPASDVWAAGVVLYRCLSGELPFPGRDARSVFAAVQRAEPARLLELDPALPPRFCAAVERALSRDLGRRYPNMRTLSRALLTTARMESIGLPAVPDASTMTEWSQWIREARDETGRVQPSVDGTSWTTQEDQSTASAERAVPRRRGRRQRALRSALLVAMSCLPVALLWHWRSLVFDRAASNHGYATALSAVASTEAAPSASAVAAPVPSAPVAPAVSPRSDSAPTRANVKSPAPRINRAGPTLSEKTAAPAEAASQWSEPARKMPAIRSEW